MTVVDAGLLNAVAAEVLDDARGVVNREQRRSLAEQTEEDRSNILYRLLQPALEKRITLGMLRKLDHITKRYAEFLGRHGIGFPQLTAIIYEQRNHVELVRADLDDGGIQIIVRNAIQRWPDITGRELAIAIHNTFPEYKQGAVVNQTEWEKHQTAKKQLIV